MKDNKVKRLLTVAGLLLLIHGKVAERIDRREYGI